MVQQHDSLRDIHVGQDIVSADGEKIGTVDSVVLNAENRHLEHIISGQGIFSQPKLIDIGLIERVDSSHIVLGMTASQVDALPDFVQTQYIEAPDSALSDLGPAWEASAAGRVYIGGPVGAAPYPGGFVPAPSTTAEGIPPDETITNLPPQDVVISEGTAVIGADGKKIGNVDHVIFGDGGNLQGFVVKSGFIFHRDIVVPIEAVADVGANTIRLTVPADEMKGDR